MGFLDKVKDLAAQNADKVEAAIEKVGDIVDEKCHVVYHGVETDRFTYTEPQPDDGERPFRLVCVATFERCKGHKYLVEAVRQLAERGVPLVVWGAHRIWTKDHPKALGRNKFPVTVAVGAPLAPVGTADRLEAELRTTMTALLHDAQQAYDHPPGAYWVPRRLGGSAPTVAEARQLEEAELAERQRRRAGRQ